MQGALIVPVRGHVGVLDVSSIPDGTTAGELREAVNEKWPKGVDEGGSFTTVDWRGRGEVLGEIEGRDVDQPLEYFERGAWPSTRAKECDKEEEVPDVGEETAGKPFLVLDYGKGTVSERKSVSKGFSSTSDGKLVLFEKPTVSSATKTWKAASVRPARYEGGLSSFPLLVASADAEFRFRDGKATVQFGGGIAVDHDVQVARVCFLFSSTSGLKLRMWRTVVN